MLRSCFIALPKYMCIFILMFSLFSMPCLLQDVYSRSLEFQVELFNSNNNTLALTENNHSLRQNNNTCKMDFGKANLTNSFTVVNWIKVAWSIQDKGILWMQIEAETRGWVAVGFSQRAKDISDSETIISWFNSTSDSSFLKMYNADKNTMELRNLTTTGFEILDSDVCQSREGRTILKFKRKFNDGQFPIPYPAYKTTSTFIILAIGEEDDFSPVLEKSSFSILINPNGEEAPEGMTARWIYHYILIAINILAFFVK